MTDVESRAGARSVAALSTRAFRIFFAGQLVSTIGTWMQITGQAWLVLDLSDSGAALGITTAVQFVPMLVLGPWVGVVADRVDKRALLIATNVFGASSALGLATLAATGSVAIEVVYAFALAAGVTNAFDRGVGPAFVSELVDRPRLPSAVGLHAIANSAARMLGPGAAGLTIATWGTPACFFLNSASFVFVAATLLLIRPNEVQRGAPSDLRPRLRDGLRHAWEHVELRRTLVAAAVVGTLTFNFITMVPAMINFTFHADALAFGIAELFSGMGSVIAGLGVGAIRKPDSRTVAVAAAALGVAAIAAGLAPGLLVFYALMFAIGLTAAAYATTSTAVVQMESDPAARGRVTSLLTMALMGTTPIGSLIMGAVVETWSARAAMVLAGSAAIASSGALFATRQ